MESVVSDFLTTLAGDEHRAENTIAAYRNDILQLSRYLQRGDDAAGVKPIDSWEELQSQHLTTYLNSLQRHGYAQATVARKGAAIRAFCSYLAKGGVVRAAIADNLVAPQVGRYTPAVISREEADKLLSAPHQRGLSRPESLRDVAMLEMLYRTGMRVGEMVGLDVSDVNLDEGTVRCGTTEGRTRQVQLQDTVTDAVRTYLQRSRPRLANAGESALFVNHRGGRLTRQGFWLIIKAYAAEVGIDEITPHTLRHSFALHALQDGRSVKDVQRTLGHVSQSTTNVYLDLVDELAASD